MPKYVTTNLRFEEPTWNDLRYRARRSGKTIALLVREAVDLYLGRGTDPAVSEKSSLDWLIGIGDSPVDDESVNHDHYLYGLPKESERETRAGHKRGASARVASGSKPRDGATVRAKKPKNPVGGHGPRASRSGDTPSSPRKRRAGR